MIKSALPQGPVIDFYRPIDYSYRMIEKVMRFAKEHHMLPEGGTVVAGVSGGADSVCLLFILLQMRKQRPFDLVAVHVNHKIREEAGEDAAFVEALCRRWDCPYRYVEEDVARYARERHLSEEEAGRLVRYGAFERVLEERGAPEGRIAVAHNQNDNGETVLFHLFRGSGLRGLSGIRPVRERVIRPLLCVSREEIERFLEENGISYCIDRTNSEDTYTRNKIRHHILSYARREICSRAVPHIYDASVMIGEADAFIRDCAEKAFGRCGRVTPKEILFDIAAYEREEPFIRRQVLLLAMERMAEGGKDISMVHIRLLSELFTRAENGRLDLPGGLCAWREYGRVRLAYSSAGQIPDTVELIIPGTVRWGKEISLTCRLFPCEKSINIQEKTYTKWIDYDKIVKSLVLRTRRVGDYLQIRADGGRKSLKSFMINEKIPAAVRDEMPLVADGSHIVWIPGYRISGHYKIDRRTRTILQMKMTGGNTDGGEDQGSVDGGSSGCQDT